MIELIKEYKYWKSKLTPNYGFENCGEEIMWNDGIQCVLDALLKGVDPTLADFIRKGYI